MTRGFREDNNNWRGGRLVASNGYILVRVGVGHHLADVRGYAYEHRLIAEEKIGRQLAAGEQVHHVNGDKQDNRPENLEVCSDVAHHRSKHRAAGRALRNPGEANPIIQCGCGCGQLFPKFDGSGRPRKFISGHNAQTGLRAMAIAYLECVPEQGTTRLMAEMLCVNEGSLRNMLGELKKEGVVRLDRNEWRLARVREYPAVPAGV